MLKFQKTSTLLKATFFSKSLKFSRLTTTTKTTSNQQTMQQQFKDPNEICPFGKERKKKIYLFYLN